jgi:hypothetical protein
MDVFCELIQAAEKDLCKAGVQRIFLWCAENSPYYHALLEQKYFDQGAATRQPIIVYSNTEEGKSLLEKEAKWHFVLADSDNI